MLNNGRGKKRLTREAEVIMPCAFSYQEIGVHFETLVNSFFSMSYALPPEKKNIS
jgi:hypothetical protein